MYYILPCIIIYMSDSRGSVDISNRIRRQPLSNHQLIDDNAGDSTYARNIILEDYISRQYK